MDNLDQWAREVAEDELPFEEALARLYELRDRYEAPTAGGLAGSAARRHLDAYGHRLAFGCCRDEREVKEALGFSQRKLLAETYEELFPGSSWGRLSP